MKYVLLLLCILSGCTNYTLVEPTKEEFNILEETIFEWDTRESLNPTNVRCQEELSNVKFFFPANDEEMKDMTFYCLPGCTERYGDRLEEMCPYGCAAGSMHYGEEFTPIIVGARDSWPKVLPHEAAHWLAACTRTGYEVTGDSYDRYHLLDDVWAGGGVVAVVEDHLSL